MYIRAVGMICCIVSYFVPVIVHLHKFLEDLDLSRSTYSVASSPGRFFVYVTAGEKIWPGINCMCMRTILAQIALTYTEGIHLVTYSAYYTESQDMTPCYGS